MATTTLDIRAPAEQTEGTRSQVLRWLKAIGDVVNEHEPLIEIETDKVTVEVAAPASGVLREIVKAEQEEIAPGDILGRIELPASAADSAATTYDGDKSRAHSRADDAATSRGTGPSSVGFDAGDAERGLPHIGERGKAGVPSSAAMSPSRSAKASDPGASDQSSAPRSVDALSRMSPAVRRLITERGLDPATIRGSGANGRITVDDVLAHDPTARAGNPRSPAPTTGQPANLASIASAPSRSAASSQPMADSQRVSRTVPHTVIRKRIAEHMVQSLLHTAPHVTTVFEADMTAVIAHRTRNRAEFEKRGTPLTFTAYFLAASVEAIRVVPEANSRWTDTALEIYDTINIGVATALEAGGLVVPVLRNVESRSLFDIAQGLNALVTAAREGRLEPADVRTGTFTISNHGVSGSLLATPIVINQPQSAILGVGKLEKRAVVVGQDGAERIVIQPKCYVTLTIDHRVMDGHQANRFLQTFVSALENWPAQ